MLQGFLPCNYNDQGMTCHSVYILMVYPMYVIFARECVNLFCVHMLLDIIRIEKLVFPQLEQTDVLGFILFMHI